MRLKNDIDYLEEETAEEHRSPKSRKMYLIIMMILSFILGAVTYRSYVKIFMVE